MKNIATAKVGPDSESVGEDVGQCVGHGGAQDEVDLQELIIMLITHEVSVINDIPVEDIFEKIYN